MPKKPTTTTNKLAYGANSLIYILLVIGIVAMVNIISTRFFVRYDLTEAKEYTISEASKKIVGRMDDIVNIKCYFSEKLPPQVMHVKNQVRDLLEEFKAYSKGNLRVKFLDPEADEETKKSLQMMGIPQVPLQVIERDKRQTMAAYLGIAITYGDNQQVLPIVANTNTLEYDISSAILKVLMKEPKSIGTLVGHDERDFYDRDGCDELRREIEKVYRFQKIELDRGYGIPKHLTTLIVAGPKGLTEPDLYDIDQFIMNGGNVLFLVDTMRLQKGRIDTEEWDSGLDPLLAHYGVRVNNDILREYNPRAMAMASFSSGQMMRYTVPYGYWLKTVGNLFNREIPVVSQLENLVYPWTSSIEILSSKPEDITASVITQTSPNAAAESAPYTLQPDMRMGMTQPPSGTKQYNTTVILEGQFKSYFEGKEPPVRPDSGRKIEDKKKDFKAASSGAKLIVIGNSRFMTDQQMMLHNGNPAFMMNLLDWVTMGEDLIGIRSRGATDRPLEDISETKKSTYKFLNNFGMAIIVAIIGVVRFAARRRRKALTERILRGKEA